MSNGILGPLLYKQKETGNTMVIGIVSFGFACASPDKPGYYSRVNQVLPWIKDVMSNGSTCPPEDKNPIVMDGNKQNRNTISSSAFYTCQSGFMQASLPNSSCVFAICSSIMVIVWQIKILTYDFLCFANPIFL